MAKKNNKKFLPKAGSTVAVALAMTVALSTQAYASELDDTTTPDTGNLPVDENTTDIVLNPDEMEPKEYNEAVDEVNKDIAGDNQATGDQNDKTELDNELAADNNENTTGGELENPNLELDSAPEIPNTDGMDVEDHNSAVGEYNGKVDEYNNAVDDYNNKVDEYNSAAGELDQKAQEEYENETLPEYNEDKAAYEQYLKDKAEYDAEYAKYLEDLAKYENETLPDYEKQSEAYQKYLADKAKYDAEYAKYLEDLAKHENETLPEYNEDKAAYEQYLKDKAEYDAEYAKYLEDKAKYENETLPDYEKQSEAYQKYLADKAKYDAEYAKYLEDLAKHENETLPEYNEDKAAYEQYLKDKAEYDAEYAKYLEDMAKYENETLPDYEKQSEAYQKYLADKAKYDAEYAKYLEDLAKYENTDLPAYEEKVEQSEKEQEILDDVNKYNEDVAAKNDQIEKDNEALEKDLDVGVVESVEDVGEINKNVEIGEDDRATLNTFDKLAEEQTALQAEGVALANHAGKDADLGSAEYAAYLEAVAAYNAKVDAFNEKVRVYNEAVAAYNEAVDTYNANKETSSESTTGNGTSQGSSSIDWGNVAINNDTVGHVDVKYQAAASKDVTVENGEPTYSDTVTQYEVTGVYTDETTAAGGTSTDYGLNFDNDGPGEQEAGTQELHKDASYAEFGSDHFGFNQPSYDKVEELDTTKTYYISNGYNGYQEIKFDTRTGTWKTTGRYPQTVDVSNRNVYEKNEKDKVAIDPATGTVSFYVTLDDGTDTHGINVNLNAGSVYAKGSYYKAKFNNKGEETDFLNQYVSSTGATIPVVWIENEDGTKEKYYDISGQSVFLISALTCDGMRSSGGNKLNPDGLDLILNLQTMIEIHQSDSAKKVSFLDYELVKYAATENQTVSDPGEAPEAPEAPEKIEEVKNPGEAPEAPEAPEKIEEVKNPGEAPEAPEAPEKIEEVKNPGEAPEAPEAPEKIEEVKNPGEAPEAPEAPEKIEEVKNPGEAPEAPEAPEKIEEVKNPGEKPDAPAALERLEHVDHLEKLNEKLTVLFDDPKPDPKPNPKPDPKPDPKPPVPVVVNDEIEIPDELVPLADAPKTGDISMLWAALSGLSAGGFFFLRKKGKYEE